MIRPQPDRAEILRGTNGREGYRLGLIALGSTETSDTIVALRGLHALNQAGELQPPIPSVRNRQIEDTLNIYDGSGLETFDWDAAKLLLATVVDIGIVRHPNG